MNGLTRVIISESVLTSCLVHALSTEHQEVLGLLTGQINELNQAIIIGSLILKRHDKQKDRVEVSYSDLANASDVCSNINKFEGCNSIIIGWYHSHPHITVLPSHVDVKTQGSYQQLHHGFIGLIFSVFDKGRIEICAFQSIQNENLDWERLEVPIQVKTHLSSQISNANMQSLENENVVLKCVNNKILDEMLRTKDLSHLLIVFLALFSEEKDLFLKMSTQQSSHLYTCKIHTVYQSAILRLVDYQLKALQFSLKSRIESLRQKKRLIKKTSNLNIQLTLARSKFIYGDDVFNFKLSNLLPTTINTWLNHCRVIEAVTQHGIKVHKIDVYSESKWVSFAASNASSISADCPFASQSHGVDHSLEAKIHFHRLTKSDNIGLRLWDIVFCRYPQYVFSIITVNETLKKEVIASDEEVSNCQLPFHITMTVLLQSMDSTFDNCDLSRYVGCHLTLTLIVSPCGGVKINRKDFADALTEKTLN